MKYRWYYVFSVHWPESTVCELDVISRFGSMRVNLVWETEMPHTCTHWLAWPTALGTVNIIMWELLSRWVWHTSQDWKLTVVRSPGARRTYYVELLWGGSSMYLLGLTICGNYHQGGGSIPLRTESWQSSSHQDEWKSCWTIKSTPSGCSMDE